MTAAFNAKKRRHWLTMQIATASLVALAACAPAADAAQTHVVEIRGFAFVPATISVRRGDTITWVNKDVAPHTATARNGDWDSVALNAGEQWSLVVEIAGAVDYVCSFHPQMGGAINVGGAQ